MTSFKTIFIIVLFVAAVGHVSVTYGQSEYPGTNTRGKVALNDKKKNYPPLQHARIDLYHLYPGEAKWVRIAKTYTDDDGFYYFDNIKPDNYTIQVNKDKNFNVTIDEIDYNEKKFQDLPIIYY